jgi:hypothetical protein
MQLWPVQGRLLRLLLAEGFLIKLTCYSTSDAARVMQAQTVANFFLAFDQNLAIVPVLNKIDMSSADPDKVAEEMQQVPLVTVAVTVTSYCYLYVLNLSAMSMQHGFARFLYSPAWHAVGHMYVGFRFRVRFMYLGFCACLVLGLG